MTQAIAVGGGSRIASCLICHRCLAAVEAGAEVRGRRGTAAHYPSETGRPRCGAPGKCANVGPMSMDTQRGLGFLCSSAWLLEHAPFRRGAIALLWSDFPGAGTDEEKLAITRFGRQSRNAVVPPLLDAWAAYETISRR